VVQRGLDGGLRSRDVLEFATVDGARACGLAARDAVLVVGRVVKREGLLVHVDLAALKTRLFESRNRVAPSRRNSWARRIGSPAWDRPRRAARASGVSPGAASASLIKLISPSCPAAGSQTTSSRAFWG